MIIGVITMGQAIFSNINDVVHGKTDQSYHRIVKRFAKELKKQKIVPKVQAGYIKNFIGSEIITYEKIKRIFRFGWNIEDFIYAEVTIFYWE